MALDAAITAQLRTHLEKITRPVVLAASEATAPLLAEQGASGPPGRWLAILAIYDLTIGLVAYGVFDFLLED